jgi:hypothetical protein
MMLPKQAGFGLAAPFRIGNGYGITSVMQSRATVSHGVSSRLTRAYAAARAWIRSPSIAKVDLSMPSSILGKLDLADAESVPFTADMVIVSRGSC